jgi:hypothetical protein
MDFGPHTCIARFPDVTVTFTQMYMSLARFRLRRLSLPRRKTRHQFVTKTRSFRDNCEMVRSAGVFRSADFFDRYDTNCKRQNNPANPRVVSQSDMEARFRPGGPISKSLKRMGQIDGQPFSLHQSGVAHQTSLRPRSIMVSYANSPQGGGSPNQSAGDSSHHNAVQAFPHRHHRFSAASVHDDRTRCNQSGPAT